MHQWWGVHLRRWTKETNYVQGFEHSGTFYLTNVLMFVPTHQTIYFISQVIIPGGKQNIKDRFRWPGSSFNIWIIWNLWRSECTLGLKHQSKYKLNCLMTGKNCWCLLYTKSTKYIIRWSLVFYLARFIREKSILTLVLSIHQMFDQRSRPTIIIQYNFTFNFS